jgi:hypothetical protein
MATKKENAEVTATTNEAKPTRKVKLPRATGQYAPTQEFYSVNFKNYIIERGKYIEVPEELAEAIENGEKAEEAAWEYATVDKKLRTPGE